MMRPCDYENVSPISIMGTYEIQTDMGYVWNMGTILEMKKNNKIDQIISTNFILFSPTAKRILVGKGSWLSHLGDRYA